MRIRTLLCLAAVLSAAHAADEWPRFRGPNGSGVALAPNLPLQFSEADYNWRTTLPGKGHSSPVIANGRVFVTCTVGSSRVDLQACKLEYSIVSPK